MARRTMLPEALPDFPGAGSVSDYSRAWGFGPPDIREVPLGLPHLDDIPDRCACLWGKLSAGYFRSVAVSTCPVHAEARS